MNFVDLGLSEPVLKAVTESGYTTPTPVQEQAIPQILMGRDLLGFAPTGTGKTAGFILPMLDILASGRHRARMPRSIILSPTRELAAQIADNFDTYGKYVNLTKALLIGGVGFEEQERLLDRGVDVLIATPGRLLDHQQQGRIMLNDVKILVIDEADRMLDMGFIPDIEKIVSFVPSIRQTLMFSATMPNEILGLAKKFLMNPREVKVARTEENKGAIDQFYVKAPNDFKAKRELLRDVLRQLQVKNAYIFCNRKKDVDILAKSLQSHGFSAGAMHGDMDQFDRNKIFDAFKGDQISLLVCSDVAARGLDVMDVSHVINFDVPFNVEDYTHRVGRTGRAGKTGCAVMLVNKYDEKYFDPISKQFKDNLKLLQVESANVADEDDDAEQPSRHHNRHHRRPRHPHGRRQPGAGAKAHAGKPMHAPKPIQYEGNTMPHEDTQDDDIGNRIPDDADNQIPENIGNREPGERNGPRQGRGRNRNRSRGGKNRDRNSDNQNHDQDNRNPNRNRHSSSDSNQNRRTDNLNRNQPRRDRDSGNDKQTGLGDHIPAFLLRK